MISWYIDYFLVSNLKIEGIQPLNRDGQGFYYSHIHMYCILVFFYRPLSLQIGGILSIMYAPH